MLKNCNNTIIADDTADVNTVNASFTKHIPKIQKQYELIAKEYNDDEYRYRANRVADCGSFLEFAKYLKSGLKLTKANFCGDRLCTMCTWRRSLRTFAKLARIVDSKQFKETKYQTIFLTLTLQNAEPNELHQSLNHIFYSFDKFLKNKRIKAMNKGFFRGLEIKYSKRLQNFHHHLHLVFAVNATYFKNDTYIKQDEYTDIWEKSADIWYKPRVYIEKVRDKGGIAEISKYCIKVDDELLKNISLENLKILRDELSNRRLVGMGGIFRTLSNELKLNLSDDNITSDDIPIDDILLALLRFRWSLGTGSYELVEKEDVGF